MLHLSSTVCEDDVEVNTESITSPSEPGPSGCEGRPAYKEQNFFCPLSKLLQNVFIEEKSCKNPTDHARSKLVQYEAEEVLDLDSNPLKRWEERNTLSYFV